MVNWFDITKLTFSDSVIEKTITITTANRYKGDFFGLLKREFNIPEEHIIPNMIVNDLDSSTSYDGRTTSIKLIPSDKLLPYT